MRLFELEPEFLKISGDSWVRVETIEACDGLMYLCPECFRRNNGNVGTHMMICWKPHVSLIVTPGPGRWPLSGTSFEDLTVEAGPTGQSSVLIQGGCNAHFYIRKGEIIFT